MAVPGKIVAISNATDEILRAGKVSFGGILKEVNLACVPEANLGDYVLVHVGFAISRIEEGEANRVFEYLRQIGELQEIEEHAPAAPGAGG